jgi:hypothetical protein
VSASFDKTLRIWDISHEIVVPPPPVFMPGCIPAEHGALDINTAPYIGEVGVILDGGKPFICAISGDELEDGDLCVRIRTDRGGEKMTNEVVENGNTRKKGYHIYKCEGLQQWFNSEASKQRPPSDPLLRTVLTLAKLERFTYRITPPATGGRRRKNRRTRKNKMRKSKYSRRR